jgi:hypothetical protein
VHWTLQTLILLCVAAAIFNVVEWLVARTVRVIGLLVCAGWSVQQCYWWLAGVDSLALFVASDAAIIGWFLWQRLARRRTFDVLERIIALSIPFTTALAAFQWLNDGHTVASWWANWWLVAGQMMLGLPVLKRQRGGGTVSHGQLRGQSHGSL